MAATGITRILPVRNCNATARLPARSRNIAPVVSRPTDRKQHETCNKER